MIRNFFKRKRRYSDIAPDEILIDAQNLPNFDTSRLEGRIERPISPSVYTMFLFFGICAAVIFSGALFDLQILNYAPLSARAEANRLNHSLVLAERGRILDRFGKVLAGNSAIASFETGIATTTATATEYRTERDYPLASGGAVPVGYVSYPKRDQNGNWYQTETQGVVGAEAFYNTKLQGTNGLRIAETTATGEVVSGSIVRAPKAGADIKLSFDAGLQRALYDAIQRRSDESGWRGGAGAIMDIQTGEVYALASYPSFDPHIMSSGEPKEAVKKLLASDRSPFLDRAVAGLYAPGSVVKPFMAIAALEERIISPEKKILSTGALSIPNPYNPTKPTIFKDWKAHGWTDMREAIAVSSDVYFYQIGGGFKDQKGLGIAKIEKYMRLFGFGKETGVPIGGEEFGTVPNPEWKANMFDGERWFLGNTYHTAIGQYGFQVTLIQLVHSIAAIANGGTLVVPVIEAGAQGVRTTLPIASSSFQVARDGMRLAVTAGSAQALAVHGVRAAGKTGTAEVGARKEFINSLIVGFFPYEKPRYAFAIVMERAKSGTPQGAPAVMGEVLRWIASDRPDMVNESN